MVSNEIHTRIRYGETDQMGFVYYGNYALFFEIGRTELMRKLGFPYRRLEDYNIQMPVLELNIKFLKPIFYDELIMIKTSVFEKPGIKIRFDYEVYTEKNELATTGNTVLAFIDKLSKKPKRPDSRVLSKFDPYF
jgi:acyl-CoA thioester hydrolase